MLPVLYKKSNTGAIQWWAARAHENQVTVEYGFVDGASQITTEVCKGKNLGKRNATTAEEQALLRAKSLWDKKLKSGYVVSIEDAKAGLVDDVIEGGIVPMRAYKYADYQDEVTAPAFTQPKLDGMKCIATSDPATGEVTLWSLGRRRILSVPHIVRALEQRLAKGAILDGELYNHDIRTKDRAGFDRLMSLCKRATPADGHEQIEYHVYDMPSNSGTFAMRTEALAGALANRGAPVLFVPTSKVGTERELMDAFDTYVSSGYEGLMVRTMNGLYENKRSKNLLKLKKWQDAEFEIIGVKEGKGRMAGRAVFICATPEGKVFDCSIEGTLEQRAAYFNDHSLWEGKMLEIKFQNYTKDGIPRCLVGKAIRERGE